MFISINSNCNNKCSYCFLPDEYHNKNVQLSYDQVARILDWAGNCKRIGILGGEPTLHPKIVAIMKEVRSRCDNYSLLTNLLCNKEILESIIDVAPNIYLHININSRKELKHLFTKNMDYLSENRQFIKRLHFSITLTGNEQFDNINIQNCINLGEIYGSVIDAYRIGIATPCHRQKFQLLNYDKIIEKFFNLLKEKTPNITAYIDGCSTNYCQISDDYKSLQEKYGTCFMGVNLHSSCTGATCVYADESIAWCASSPKDFLAINHYSLFDNFKAAESYFKVQIEKYMAENAKYCKSIIDCQHPNCEGPCVSINEYLKRQNMNNL